MLKRNFDKWVLILIMLSFVVVFTGCRNELILDSEVIENTESDTSGNTGSDSTTDDTTTDDTTTDDTSTNIVETFVPSGVWENASVDNPIGGNDNAYDFKVGDDVVFSLTNNWQGNELTAALEGDEGFSVTIDTEAEAGWWAQLNGDFSQKLTTGLTYKLVISAKASEASRFKASINFSDSDRVVDSELILTTEYQTFEAEFVAKDATVDPSTSIERMQFGMGNDAYEENTVNIVTTGVTFYINEITIQLVE